MIGDVRIATTGTVHVERDGPSPTILEICFVHVRVLWSIAIDGFVSLWLGSTNSWSSDRLV